MDFKLEVVVVPVADVDRAKAFYQGLGKYEEETGKPDPDRPTWYAQYRAGESGQQAAGS